MLECARVEVPVRLSKFQSHVITRMGAEIVFEQMILETCLEPCKPVLLPLSFTATVFNRNIIY